jgi:hypothetical protein
MKEDKIGRYVARMELRNVSKILNGIPKRGDDLEDLC